MLITQLRDTFVAGKLKRFVMGSHCCGFAILALCGASHWRSLANGSLSGCFRWMGPLLDGHRPVPRDRDHSCELSGADAIWRSHRDFLIGDPGCGGFLDTPVGPGWTCALNPTHGLSC